MSFLQKILEDQFRKYRNVQVQDVYKLLYQGTFGPEHAVNEKSGENLYEEFEKAKLNKTESILERISPSFLIYRVNIRPYKFFGGSKEMLFEWFHESSKIKEVGTQGFLAFWAMFKKINKEENYFPAKELENFENKYIIGKKKLPVMSHSKQYKKANDPSYRVVNYRIILKYIGIIDPYEDKKL